MPHLGDDVDCHVTPRVQGWLKMRDRGWGGGSGRRETRRHPWGTPKLKGSVRGGGSASAVREWTGCHEAQMRT